MSAKAHGSMDPVGLRKVANGSPELNSMCKRNADEIKRRAIAVFAARQVTTNEWRTSVTTPPKYITRFVVARIPGPNGSFLWEVRNTDPGAQFVEYGAHAGGRTPVLGYRPLTTALLATGATK